MQIIQTLLARALLRLAIAAAPAPMAEELRRALGSGGGPRPVLPK